MKPQVEQLETRDLPAVILAGGTLSAFAEGRATDIVFTRAGDTVTVVQDGVTSVFNGAGVQRVLGIGSHEGDRIQVNGRLDGTLVGLAGDDFLSGGTGNLNFHPGAGADVVYSILPAGNTDTVTAAGDGKDRLHVNAGDVVSAGPEDVVLAFFAPGRLPGSGFLGLDPSLADRVLYITPTNGGSFVSLADGPGKRETVVTYDLDLSDGFQPRVQSFTGLRAVSYFGGAGTDTYTNDTELTEAAYGSAGNDVLVSGYGDVLLKGSGGDDVLVYRGRGRLGIVDPGPGADLVFDFGRGLQVVNAGEADFLPAPRGRGK